MIRTALAILALMGALPAAAQISLGEQARADRLSAIIEAANFSGDVSANRGSLDFTPAYGWIGLLPEQPKGEMDGIYWRWGSVTKQVVAVLVMQEVSAGKVDLDAPLARYLPGFGNRGAANITVRQLLQNRSGLPNPDDTAASPGALPAYYAPGYRGSRDPLTGYCGGALKGSPGDGWSSNDCDYLVLGALLERVTGKRWDRLVQERIAKPLGLETLSAYPTKHWTRWGMIGGKREPQIDLAAFGAAGGLYGSIDDLIAFDVALMEGKLLPPAALETMWKGDPALGDVALGQWVYEAKLAGCDAPVRIVERRGGVGGIEVRNFILPEKRVALAILSDRAPFDFGEVRQAEGFSYDLLSAAACP